MYFLFVFSLHIYSFFSHSEDFWSLYGFSGLLLRTREGHSCCCRRMLISYRDISDQHKTMLCSKNALHHLSMPNILLVDMYISPRPSDTHKCGSFVWRAGAPWRKTVTLEEWFHIGTSFVYSRIVGCALTAAALGPHCDAAVLGSSWACGRRIR